MTTLAQVKINGQYDRVEAVDPVDATDDIAVGTRWLNVATGESFEQTASGPSVWEQIELALDAQINQVLQPTYNRIISECRDALLKPRDEVLEESPATIAKTAYWYLTRYHSIYGDWVFSGATITIDGADPDSIVGNLEDLEDGDEVFIIGSKRNDGVHTISTVDTAGLTFTANLSGTNNDRFVIALAQIPEDLNRIIGRMVYYDVELRNDRLGLQRESIGNYSYQLSDDAIIGGLSYPHTVAAGIDSYLGIGPIADAEEVW
jgi:hypothetical protein